MSTTAPSETERLVLLAGFRTHVIVDDSHRVRPLIWEAGKDLLEQLILKTPFELNLINHGNKAHLQNQARLREHMAPVILHGQRDLLEPLNAIIREEFSEIHDMSEDELAIRPKLNVLVILHDLPTDSHGSLLQSAEHTVQSLEDAHLPMDRIRLHFVQLGIAKRLALVLKGMVDHIENHYNSALVDFTTYFGGTKEHPKIWKILLGINPPALPATTIPAPVAAPVFPPQPRLSSRASRPASRPVSIIGPNLPPRSAFETEFGALHSPLVDQAPSPPGSGPVFQFPAFLGDGSIQTTDTYHLNAGFTITGWVRVVQRDRSTDSAPGPYEFLTFHSGELPVLRASIGVDAGGQRNGTVTMWFPGVSANPTAHEFPIGVWAFICAIYESASGLGGGGGGGLCLGFNGQLGPQAVLNRIQFDKIIIGLYTSNSSPSPVSLARFKVYDRVLSENEIQSDYLNQSPSSSALAHHVALIRY